MNCCVCGGQNKVKWCDICHHYFCYDCRWGKGLFSRGVAFVKEWIADHPPKYCEHGRNHQGE